MNNIFDNPILVSEIYHDLNTNKKILDICSKDNSYINLDVIKKETKKKTITFKRIPVVKTNKKVTKYIWLSKRINYLYRKKHSIRRIVPNSKLIISNKNNLLLSESKYWDTFVITNTVNYEDLKEIMINGFEVYYKFNNVNKQNNVRSCLGYFRIDEKRVISVLVISVAKKASNPTIIQIKDNIYFILNGICYRTTILKFNSFINSNYKENNNKEGGN